MRTVLVLQHARCETLGTIADALEPTGISPQFVRTFEGQPVPLEMGEAAGLIVMGGPMGVYEQARYPFLQDELRLIERALRAQKPVLGVCLGSQLLAAALGSAVTKGKQKEIGWYPVRLADAARTDHLWNGVGDSFVAYHWHGDVFDLPAGGVSLASSSLTPCQAFRYANNAYGFLFHAEVTQKMIEDMVATFSEELREAGGSSEEIARGATAYLPGLRKISQVVFGRWASLLLTPSKSDRRDLSMAF
jgi:GMP synthase (glutamine-hydrolysing)